MKKNCRSACGSGETRILSQDIRFTLSKSPFRLCNTHSLPSSHPRRTFVPQHKSNPTAMAFVTSRSTLDSLMGPALRTSVPGEQPKTLPRQRPLRDLRMRSETNLLSMGSNDASLHANLPASAKRQSISNFSRPLARASTEPVQQRATHQNWQIEDLHAAQPRRSSRSGIHGGSRRNRSMVELSRRKSSLPPVQEIVTPAEERAMFLDAAEADCIARGGPSPLLPAAPFPQRVHHPEPLIAFTRVPHRTASSTTKDWLLKHSGPSTPLTLENDEAAHDLQPALRAATLSPDALAQCLDALQFDPPRRPSLCATPGLVSDSSTDDSDSLAESTGSAGTNSTSLPVALPLSPTPVKVRNKRASLTGDLWRGLKKTF
jgi:hypothetical protein